MRKPSPAVILSLIALFVALGGTGYAAVKLNGKNIKNRTIAGKKLKNNTVTGKQVREGRLGKVPSAARADLATNATNATNALSAATLAGQDPGAFFPSRRGVSTNGVVKLNRGEAPKPIIQFGPFTLTARCDDDGGDPRIRVDLTSTEAGSALDGTEGTETLDVADVSSTSFSQSGNHNIDMAAPGGAALSLVSQYGVNALGAECFVSMFGIGSP